MIAIIEQKISITRAKINFCDKTVYLRITIIKRRIVDVRHCVFFSCDMWHTHTQTHTNINRLYHRQNVGRENTIFIVHLICCITRNRRKSHLSMLTPVVVGSIYLQYHDLCTFFHVQSPDFL